MRSIDALGGRFAKKPIARLAELSNKRVEGVRCRGKVIVLDFEGGVSAVSTLGMSGRWTRQEGKHAALRLWCELPPTRGLLPVFYDDQRRFGDFRVVDARDATSKLDGLGWDALAEPQACGKVAVRARKYSAKATPLCEVMLDQEVFAGCGNYLRAEAMLKASIDPWREWRSLSSEEVVRLCQALATVSSQSYSRGGATLETFYGGDGERGDHVDFLECYGRSHDQHGNPVERRKDKKGRTVWWSPAIQCRPTTT